MDQFRNTVTLVIELLLVISIVAIFVRRLRVPYTVALVVVGLAITFQQPPQTFLTSELILALFVPPLVFEAAFHLNLTELRANLASILLLAIPGVIITTIVVGGLLALGTSLSLPVALVFGALIAATDPIAVISLFRMLAVPKRLSVLVEGESLLNDGTAIVLFNLLLGIALTGHFSIAASVFDFARVSAGGILVGLVLGWFVSRLIARVDDYLVETTLTTVLAFGAYLVAEYLHFSGVLAVVAAGVVNGNLGPRGMSPTTRIVLSNFWEYVAFLANSLVFLLIGLQVNIPALAASWQPIVWAVASVLAARVIVVYGLSWIMGKLDQAIALPWQHVLLWGGLRGAISLALVLSLPVELGPDLALLRVMAFGVVLFTLLVQGTTMGTLIERLGITIRNEAQIEYETRHARLAAVRSAASRLDHLHRKGLVSTHTWDALKPDLEKQTDSLTGAVLEILETNPALEAKELEVARREVLRAQRSALQGLRHDGVISDEVFIKLAAQLDSAFQTTNGVVEGNDTENGQ